MWGYQIVLGILGLLFGIGVAAGVFALVASLGMVPRIAGKTSNFPAASISGWLMVSCSLWIGVRCIFRLPGGGTGRSTECISGIVSQS